MGKSATLLTLTLSLLCVNVYSQTTNNGSTTTTATTSQTTSTKASTSTSASKPPGPTPSLPPSKECPKHNSSCSECVSYPKCFYCFEHNNCMEYPASKVLPTDLCALSQARWGVCWVNFEALIIAFSVIGGVILLTITCCCIRCFCCGKNNKKYMKEEAKWERQKADRKQRSEERRADRKEKMDEIRRKYGLVKEDTPYQRFDA